MAKIKWDQEGQKTYETGVKNGVLYVIDDDGKYSNGVAWNGLTNVNESPSGAEESPYYADDVKYLSLTSAEEFGASVEAYTYPEEFEVCDGSVEILPGISASQQTRKKFGLCYRTTFGNDVKGNDYGYKLHLVYGAQAAPSERGYSTINDSPEPITFSWELTTTPVEINGFKPTSILKVDSTKMNPDKLAILENILYGTDDTNPRLPLPNELMELLGGESIDGLEFVSIEPENNTIDIPISQPITLMFNNKIKSLSYTLMSNDGDIIDSQLTIEDNKATIISPQPLAGGKNYILVVNFVTDIYSQTLGMQVYKFTTIA